MCDALKGDVLSGKCGSGRRLPSVGMLAKRFYAARATIRHAVEELAHQALASRRQGSGTFVKTQTRESETSRHLLDLRNLYLQVDRISAGYSIIGA